MTQTKTKTNSSGKKALTSYVEIKNIISQILFGEELKSILNVILTHAEGKLPQTQALILLYNENSKCLLFGAAPSLPESFVQKVHGIQIGPTAGCCGSAAYFKSTTVVRDTLSDPLWASYIGLAKEYGLRACWSVPILNMKGELLGTFALYYKKTHKPTQKETILVKELIDIACLAIERERSAILKKESEKEIQIQRTNALNSLKHASVGEMAKNISHEVNSPLAIIRGSVHQMNRIIDQPGDNKVTLRMHTARLERSVVRIEKIVKGLSSLTREASNDPFLKTDARTLIDDALSIFQERFLTSNVRSIVIGELDVLFECRSVQIFQVLISLLDNSYEAISKSENPWILIHVMQYDQKIRLEITDSGNGIPTSIVEKIMVPLFTTKVHSRATGLGLSVSQALIQEHSGKIWYDKSCHRTRFVIELPLEQVSSLKQAA
ncbi:MAG: GAF domain-containing sensor histidine kinase [Bacteriovorax sp.]|nr:GAF domain-containing sensor histidine kinase [Bacteriovorax sp.]